MNTTPRVRWLTNLVLDVENMEGETEEVQFSSGNYTLVDKIIRFPDGYLDIYLKNNSGIIRGINFKDVLEIHGKIKIEEVDNS